MKNNHQYLFVFFLFLFITVTIVIFPIFTMMQAFTVYTSVNTSRNLSYMKYDYDISHKTLENVPMGEWRLSNFIQNYQIFDEIQFYSSYVTIHAEGTVDIEFLYNSSNMSLVSNIVPIPSKGIILLLKAYSKNPFFYPNYKDKQLPGTLNLIISYNNYLQKNASDYLVTLEDTLATRYQFIQKSKDESSEQINVWGSIKNTSLIFLDLFKITMSSIKDNLTLSFLNASSKEYSKNYVKVELEISEKFWTLKTLFRYRKVYLNSENNSGIFKFDFNEFSLNKDIYVNTLSKLGKLCIAFIVKSVSFIEKPNYMKYKLRRGIVLSKHYFEYNYSNPEDNTLKAPVFLFKATFGEFPELYIQKTLNTPLAKPNSPVYITLNIINLGYGNAYNVTIYDKIPQNFNYINGSDKYFFEVIPPSSEYINVMYAIVTNKTGEFQLPNGYYIFQDFNSTEYHGTVYSYNLVILVEKPPQGNNILLYMYLAIFITLVALDIYVMRIKKRRKKVRYRRR
ncbi:MAG: hypothetical protein ACP6IS_01765 [Candidatus Asgardarchaeia archaeon]